MGWRRIKQVARGDHLGADGRQPVFLGEPVNQVERERGVRLGSGYHAVGEPAGISDDHYPVGVLAVAGLLRDRHGYKALDQIVRGDFLEGLRVGPQVAVGEVNRRELAGFEYGNDLDEFALGFGDSEGACPWKDRRFDVAGHFLVYDGAREPRTGRVGIRCLPVY